MSIENSIKEVMIQRIHAALDKCGIPKRGRNNVVTEKTGYSASMVAKIMSGHAGLNERFISAICSAFSIRRKWIYEGDLPEITVGIDWLHPEYSKEDNPEYYETQEGLSEEPYLTGNGQTKKVFIEKITIMLHQLPLEQVASLYLKLETEVNILKSEKTDSKP